MMNGTIKRVLAVGAHPDDIEIFCAGTLARFVQKGVQVTMVTVTNGEKGSFELSAEELAEIRKNECREAAKVIGADWIGMGYPDGELIRSPDLHLQMIQVIQKANPDLIITLSPNDYHSDHVEVSKAVTNASFFGVCPQFSKDGVVCNGVPFVYFMDTTCGVDFVPEEYVDITETLETKLEMYSKHESQHRYLKEREGVDFTDIIKTTAHFRGLQCGAEFAEAFRPYRAWPRITTERLLP